MRGFDGNGEIVEDTVAVGHGSRRVVARRAHQRVGSQSFRCQYRIERFDGRARGRECCVHAADLSTTVPLPSIRTGALVLGRQDLVNVSVCVERSDLLARGMAAVHASRWHPGFRLFAGSSGY